MVVVQDVYYFVYSSLNGVVSSSNCIPCGDTEQRTVKEATTAEIKVHLVFGWLGRLKPRKISTEIRIGHLLNTDIWMAGPKKTTKISTEIRIGHLLNTK
jgi:hypothetical protein